MKQTCQRVRGVRDVEVNQIGPPFFGHQPQDVFHEVAVGIEERKAFPVHEVLAGEVGDQGGLAGAGLADDVHVGAAVGALDAEAVMLVAEVGHGRPELFQCRLQPVCQGVALLIAEQVALSSEESPVVELP